MNTRVGDVKTIFSPQAQNTSKPTESDSLFDSSDSSDADTSDDEARSFIRKKGNIRYANFQWYKHRHIVGMYFPFSSIWPYDIMVTAKTFLHKDILQLNLNMRSNISKLQTYCPDLR